MSVIMTEVRSIPQWLRPLAATKEYKIGASDCERELSLDEIDAFIITAGRTYLVRMQHHPKQSRTGQLKDDIPSLWESIHPTTSVPADNHGKFKRNGV
jgi:hypothetical protein